MTAAVRRIATAFAVLASCALASTSARGDDAALPRVPDGFTISAIAHVAGARELAAARNGDLFVGTSGRDVVLIPDAAGTPGTPTVFAIFPESQAAGVALGADALFVGTHMGVWRVPYRDGDRVASAAPQRIAAVRGENRRGHSTTSVAVAGEHVYASVGSSCNACSETDPTRAKIFEMSPNGAGMAPKATNIRNAIALAVDPATSELWAGVAGRDDLEHGHPYEIFDDVSATDGVRDYGWPGCYENRKPVAEGIDCSGSAVPRVAFPAYETPIGAAFYPLHPTGTHAFGTAFRGGAFVALHGSWHKPLVPPRVVYVPMAAGEPATAVNWNDPDAQWSPFVTGFQNGDGTRIGRPTGVAVGSDGSLFIADDMAGVVYRVRPR